ncbi:hypothetical protein [Actinomadura flavalba]|uniref:hypothetical protein n=1 Tax=Actinomadura flavalba TaxID=1120938 RepID=UPI00036D336A|nr:hypothetical protein [Actinomadura flavalba]
MPPPSCHIDGCERPVCFTARVEPSASAHNRDACGLHLADVVQDVVNEQARRAPLSSAQVVVYAIEPRHHPADRPPEAFDGHLVGIVPVPTCSG